MFIEIFTHDVNTQHTNHLSECTYLELYCFENLLLLLFIRKKVVEIWSLIFNKMAFSSVFLASRNTELDRNDFPRKKVHSSLKVTTNIRIDRHNMAAATSFRFGMEFCQFSIDCLMLTNNHSPVNASGTSQFIIDSNSSRNMSYSDRWSNGFFVW